MTVQPRLNALASSLASIQAPMLAAVAVALALLVPSAAPQADSGLSSMTNGVTSGPRTLAPGGRGPVFIGGPWYEFSFTTPFVSATGCAPADPNAGDCTPSSGGNSVFADPHPWTFNAAGAVALTVTDAFTTGDEFDVFDFSAFVGRTSSAELGSNCGNDPVPCFADPTVSSGVFTLGPGAHSIMIVPIATAGPGAAYFRVDSLPGCGNGIVEQGEECDGGGESSICDSDCTIAFCGDGVLNQTAGEECDDGNDVGGDGCSEFCLVETGESVEESVGAGGTVTTDTGQGATAGDPVETSVTTPNGGTITIDEGSITGTATAFSFFGQEVAITAPAATASDPLVLVFELDATIIPEGEDETSIAVFKDGVLVAACTGAPGTADPDACVSGRVLQGDGDIEITVLTSTTSDFDFGSVGCPAAPATCNESGFNITLVSDKNQVGAVVSSKAKVIFKWLRGSGSGEDPNDYGDPTAGDSILLCFYQDAALVFEMKAPPNGLWKVLPGKGFKYNDTAVVNSGIKKILLKGGDPGKAKVMVIGKGQSLPIPDLQQSLDPNSTYDVQVQSTAPGCWGRSYLAGQATNVNRKFKLKSP